MNIDEYLRRLANLSRDLSEEEQRAVLEGMSEDELAIFDLLTKPEPELTAEELVVVKAGAKRLLEHLHDKLVLDWRRKAAATASVRAIKDVLNEELPSTRIRRNCLTQKSQRSTTTSCRSDDREIPLNRFFSNASGFFF